MCNNLFHQYLNDLKRIQTKESIRSKPLNDRGKTTRKKKKK